MNTVNVAWLCLGLSAAGFGFLLGWRIGWKAAHKRDRRWNYRITLPHWTISGDGLTLAELEQATDHFDRWPARQAQNDRPDIVVGTGTRLALPVQAGATVLHTTHSIRPGTKITIGDEQRTTGTLAGSGEPYTTYTVVLAAGEQPWAQDHPAGSVVHYTTTLTDYRTSREVDQ